MSESIENPMLSVLAADGPDPRYRDRLRTFGRFVGSWDVEVTEYGDGGEAETGSAEWHFGWALAGRAVQDVWLAPSRAEQEELGVPPREWGTAVRFYEPESDTWRMAWSGPGRGRQILFVGRDEGDRIVLEGEEKGTPLRWIFSEIGADSFHWEASARSPDGEWRRVQEMRVRRQPGGA